MAFGTFGELCVHRQSPWSIEMALQRGVNGGSHSGHEPRIWVENQISVSLMKGFGGERYITEQFSWHFSRPFRCIMVQILVQTRISIFIRHEIMLC